VQKKGKTLSHSPSHAHKCRFPGGVSLDSGRGSEIVSGGGNSSLGSGAAPLEVWVAALALVVAAALLQP
jgi:hypothetical protein